MKLLILDTINTLLDEKKICLEVKFSLLILVKLNVTEVKFMVINHECFAC